MKLRGDFSASNWKKENVKPTQQSGGFGRSSLQIQRSNVLEKKTNASDALLLSVYPTVETEASDALGCRSNQHTRNYYPSFIRPSSWMNPNFF
jgi:hypothetical protein